MYIECHQQKSQLGVKTVAKGRAKTNQLLDMVYKVTVFIQLFFVVLDVDSKAVVFETI